jgi:hypothetical protein
MGTLDFSILCLPISVHTPLVLGALDMFVLARSCICASLSCLFNAHADSRSVILSDLCICASCLCISLCVYVYRCLCLHYCLKSYYRIVSFGVWPAGYHSNTQASLGEARSWMLYWIRESMIPTLLLPLGAQGLSGCHSNHL